MTLPVLLSIGLLSQLPHISLELKVYQDGVIGAGIPVFISVSNKSSSPVKLFKECVDASRPFSYIFTAVDTNNKIIISPQKANDIHSNVLCYETGKVIDKNFMVEANSTSLLTDDIKLDGKNIPLGKYHVEVLCKYGDTLIQSMPVPLSIIEPELLLSIKSKIKQAKKDEPIPVSVSLKNISSKPLSLVQWDKSVNEQFDYYFENVKTGKCQNIREPMRRYSIPDELCLKALPPLTLESQEQIVTELDLVFYVDDPLIPGDYRYWVQFNYKGTWYKSSSIKIKILP